MDTSVAEITQQIAFLNHRHLEELHLFVEFLLNKQQKETKRVRERDDRVPILADIQVPTITLSAEIIRGKLLDPLSKKERLRDVMLKMGEKNIFSNITNGVEWQKEIRNEWD